MAQASEWLSLPEPVLDAYLTTVVSALDEAWAGRATAGWGLLCRGQQSAEAAASTGDPHARVVASLYRAALYRYTQAFGESLLEGRRQSPADR